MIIIIIIIIRPTRPNPDGGYFEYLRLRVVESGISKIETCCYFLVCSFPKIEIQIQTKFIMLIKPTTKIYNNKNNNNNNNSNYNNNNNNNNNNINNQTN